MWGGGTGAEVMQRIAAPMVGGMITAPLLSMFVIPAVYLMMRRPRGSRQALASATTAHPDTRPTGSRLDSFAAGDRAPQVRPAGS